MGQVRAHGKDLGASLPLHLAVLMERPTTLGGSGLKALLLQRKAVRIRAATERAGRGKPSMPSFLPKGQWREAGRGVQVEETF